MIEKHFNVAFIADMALREKHIQQNYRPVIAVHQRFAGRPGTARPLGPRSLPRRDLRHFPA
jgi:hypothetical protein